VNSKIKKFVGLAPALFMDNLKLACLSIKNKYIYWILHALNKIGIKNFA